MNHSCQASCMLFCNTEKEPLNIKNVILILVILVSWLYVWPSWKIIYSFKTVPKSTGVVPCSANSERSQQQTDKQLGIWLWPCCRIAKRSPSILHHLPFQRLLLSYEWLILWLQQCLKLAVWYHRMPDPDQGANVKPCQNVQLGFIMTSKIDFLGEGHCAGLMPRTMANYSILNLKVHFAAC